MSYTDDFYESLNKKKKKKQDETKSTGKSGKTGSDFTSEFYSSLGEERSSTAYAPSIFDNDIGPVKEEAEERTWFKESEGNWIQTILGSGADIKENVTAGFLGIGEKLVDAGAALGAAMNQRSMMEAAQSEMMFNAITGREDSKVLERYQGIQEDVERGTAKFISKDLYDEEAIAKTIISDPLRKVGIDSDEHSVFGEKTDDLAQSAGQLGGQLIADAVLPGSGMVIMGASTFGSEMESALQNGADFDEAMFSSAVSTAAEVLTEKLGGVKFGGKTLTDAAFGALSKKVTSKFAKALVSTGKLAADASAESVEEVVSGYVSAWGQKLSYMEDKEIEELFSKEDALESAIGGFVLGGGFSVAETAMSGRDPASGLTKDEQAVVDKVSEDTIAAQEKEGKTLTEKEKSKIRDSVVEQMEKGQLDIDTIESVIGGDTYKAYKDTVESEEALKTELGELRKMKSGDMNDLQTSRMSELKEMNLDDTTKRDSLRKTLDDTISQKLTGSKLAESYRERERRGQAFEADLSKYTGKQRESVERAIKSGVLNNTYRSHELVDVLSKIEAEKGIVFDYTNNAKLKETGFAVDGVRVNGYADKNKGTVTLNVQSAKAWQSTVGHEICHVLQGGVDAKVYGELQQALYTYAESRGELESRRAALTELYKGRNANIEEELTCDLLGDYLFTDKSFVDKLTGNRTLFQKIYDEIKYLWNVATGKEKTGIEKVKDEFDRAWKELSVDGVSESDDSGEADIDFSISVTDKSTLDSLNNQLAKGEYDAETNPDGGYYVTYKSMSFWGYDEDGNAILRSPMAEYVDGELSNAYLIPKDKSKLNWYQATETIDESTGLPSGLLVKAKQEGKKSFSYLPASENQNLINEDWSNLYFNLRKKILKNGKWVNSDVPARYNPYEHSSNSMLNDQFTAAYQRDNLVTVKMYVPVSEDNGAYRAKWSKDPTGWSDWKSGIVAGKIAKQKDLQRRVYLSRYAAPVEIVPDSEVAQAYKSYLEGTDVAIPDNVVSPNLLKELKNAGVPIEESGKVQYSLSANAEAELHKALYDTNYKGEIRLRDETPSIMTSQKGVKNLPMSMKVSHTRENVFTEEEAKKLGLRVDEHTHYHGLGEKFFLQVIDGLDNVTEAYRGTKNATDSSRRENYFLLISEFKDKDGNTINVPVYINEHALYNSVFIDVNKISTVFGREGFRDYINRQIRDKNLVRIKNRSNQTSESNTLIVEDYGTNASDADSIAPIPENVNTNFSLSPETDADYMSAVGRGDTETAQRMVDEAAKNAGYTRKLYHGTASKFNVFGFGRTGIFTTDNFDMAKTYGNNVMSLYGKEGAKVLTIDAKESPHWAIEVSKDILDFSEYPLMRGKERYSTNDISLIAFREGYDVVVIDNVYDNYSAASGNTENGLGTDVVYKDPNQVKSSEAITYDDNGNVIPLSERFNESNNDIRYSLSDIGYHAGDLGKSEHLGMISGDRDTGHFGTGTYFVGNRDKLKGYNGRNGKEAPVESVDFSKYNLFKPRDNRSGKELHDFLKGVNSYYQRDHYLVQSVDGLERAKENIDELRYEVEELDNTLEEISLLSQARSVLGDYGVGSILQKHLPVECFLREDGTLETRDGEQITTSEVLDMLDDFAPLNIDLYKEVSSSWTERKVSRYEDWKNSVSSAAENLFGISGERATEIISEIRNEIESKNYNYETSKGQDSASTRFMKKLGFEGVDVRHLSELDDTYYGSVIYDLKGEDLARKNKIGTAKYSISNEDESFAPVGNYSTPFRELALDDDIAPIGDGVIPSTAKKSPLSERIASGERSDELLYESLDNYPMQTVEQKVAEKIRAVQGEIADNQELRKEAEANYEKQISNLRAKYKSKKNKETKEAGKILQSISRLERLKASAEADYAKRISDLEARVEKMSDPKYARALQKRAKMEADAKWAADLLGDTSTWKDKKIGLQYATNTERRNLRDIVRDANGNVDIAKADAIDDALNGQYNRDEAAKKKELANVRGKYAKLNITKAEDAYIQMLGEFRHNPDTTLTDKDIKEYYEQHKRKIDTEKVDRVIEMARQDYDEWLNRVNAELKKQGMKEIPYRQGYFPHFTEPKQNFIQKLLNWKTQDNEIPTSIAGLTETFKPTKSWQSFDKTRYSDETDYSFMKGFDSYSEGALDWIYHMDTLQKRRAVENHIRYTHSEEGIRDRIKQVYANEEMDAAEAQAQIEHILTEAKNPLNNFVQDFTTHTNILAGKKNSLDRTVEQWTNRHIYSVMTNVQNRMSANMVLANVRSALTNFIPITQSWVQVSPVRTLQAAKETIANSIKDDGTVDKSAFLTNRLREVDKLYQTNWDKVLDKAGIMFEIVDNFSSQVIWRSKYNQNRADGMTESDAIMNADQFAENVMAGRSKGNEPTLFNAKNPFVKAFTMFQLEVNNQYGYLFKDVPNDLKAETEHWKLNLAKGYTTAFIGAYVYNALLEKVTGSDAALDPIGIIEGLLRDLGLFDDDEEKEPNQVVTNFVDSVVEELPFVGGLFGGGRVPISSALPYSDDGLTGFVEDVSEGNWGNIGKEMMNPLLNVGLPVAGGQIKKTYQGLNMFSDEHPVSGSYTDSGKLRFPVEDTPLNRAQAAIFGQYASENAREYFDNGYAPLADKQIQEYIDSDMPISDYWKYREGLKGLTKSEEKIDYISGLDLPTSTKNILANNVLNRKEDIDLEGYEDFGSLEEFDFATKNPEKYAFAKSVGGYSAYQTYSDALYDIKADKDEYGKTINGSRKEKVLDYINNLDADYYTKIILWKSEYPSDDTYNYEVIEYINNRSDLTYEERVSVLTELGFRVTADGHIYAE